MRLKNRIITISLKAKTIIAFFLLLFTFSEAEAVIHDKKDCNLHLLLNKEKTKYVICQRHQLSDTLFVPQESELSFEGGSISGIIVFNNTKLSGNVNLKGSTIKGNIRNKTFNAAWLCTMDGITDDAKNINEIIQICKKVYFPKGEYRLKSVFNPQGIIDNSLHSAIQAHIGIYQNDVHLFGEEGAEFITEEIIGTISIFSPPNQIKRNIKNIEISGITFTVKNNGQNFHEYFHTIKTIGVNGLTIKNCIFNDFWGDAICMSHYGDNPQTGERTRNQNIKIINNHIIGGKKHNNRNGISIINGKNVIIKNNIIKNTSRNDMPGGIDIEPNNSAYTIKNIRITNNYFENVKTNAIQIYIPTDASAYQIRIVANIIKSCGNGINIGILSNEKTNGIIIKDNVIDLHTNPYHFIGNGHSKDWLISNNTFDHICAQKIPGNIKVRNLIIKNNKKKVQ